jgi:hypothetical protein
VTRSKCKKAAETVCSHHDIRLCGWRRLTGLGRGTGACGRHCPLLQGTWGASRPLHVGLTQRFREAITDWHRKWFMTTVGHEGLNNLLAAYEDKSAEAVCTFGYCEGPGQEPILFQGRCQVFYSF